MEYLIKSSRISALDIGYWTVGMQLWEYKRSVTCDAVGTEMQFQYFAPICSARKQQRW